MLLPWEESSHGGLQHLSHEQLGAESVLVKMPLVFHFHSISPMHCRQ